MGYNYSFIDAVVASLKSNTKENQERWLLTHVLNLKLFLAIFFFIFVSKIASYKIQDYTNHLKSRLQIFILVPNIRQTISKEKWAWNSTFINIVKGDSESRVDITGLYNESYHSNSIRSYYHNDSFDSAPFQWNRMVLIYFFPQRHDSFHDFQSMSISCNKKETDPSLVIDGVETESANDIKFLGITVDQCLIFNMHISYMWSKAGWQPNVLQKLRGSLDFNNGMAFYQT